MRLKNDRIVEKKLERPAWFLDLRCTLHDGSDCFPFPALIRVKPISSVVETDLTFPARPLFRSESLSPRPIRVTPVLFQSIAAGFCSVLLEQFSRVSDHTP
jgi:hypothetical protein